MPRRKQSNPQPVKLDGVESDPGCLVLDSDFLLSGELCEFGDTEIMGLDRDTGMTVFSLSDDSSSLPAPDDSTFPAFLSCKGCGQLIGADLDLGAGLHLGAGLYCTTCEEGVQSESHTALADTSQGEESTPAVQSHGRKDRKRSKAGDEEACMKLNACSLCSFSSRYSNHLKRHMRTHDGEKPYHCPHCPYASTQRVNMQRHTRTHTGEKPYLCNACSYACSSLGNLRRHQRSHSQEPRPQRTHTLTRRSRRKHTHRDNGEDAVVSDLTVCVREDSDFLQTPLLPRLPPSAPLPDLLFPLCCRSCGLTLEGEGGETEGEGGGLVCNQCSESLISKKPGSPSPSPTDTPSNTLQPGASKLYRCPLCPFLSLYPNHLARHAHTHSGEKPHRCPQCSYASAHLDNLKRHLRVHTGEKPYRCAQCAYACGNLANLRRHERIHSGAKPFHCSVCGYSCNQSMNLKRHMLRHTGEKPYGCAECDYTTGHWDNYKRHQRKHGHNADSWDKHTHQDTTAADCEDWNTQEKTDTPPHSTDQHWVQETGSHSQGEGEM
ncbi:zinc finger protein 513 [Coregonus clupeaformis]|uniref:zinc finger protein 513 n=1 Tax=Coregonus clupeaformis TaxID=59861 RepID=UPI001BE0E031|nr:zinc finger protein 513 [Coregonus clupeaformis]XP_041710445.1 zinc finger protein 513 [Coregonus clupeaformis]